MNNFYESFINSDCFGFEFYINHEYECDKFLEEHNIESVGSESGQNLFDLLKNKNINYGEFCKIAEDLNSFFCGWCSSCVMFYVLKLFGVHYKDSLKLFFDRIVEKLQDKEVCKEYGFDVPDDPSLPSPINSVEDIKSSDEGESFIQDIFTEQYFSEIL